MQQRQSPVPERCDRHNAAILRGVVRQKNYAKPEAGLGIICTTFLKANTPVQTTVHDSPIGVLTLAADEEGLRHIVFPQGSRSFAPPDSWHSAPQNFEKVRRQLDEYFDGKRQKFSLTLAPQGTPFQLSVWQALEQIPYNNTCSYGEIARLLGKPAASRAVGAANGANPLPIVIPCHRVVGATGNLTGFGGGIATKQWLLSHERGEGQLFAFTTP